MRNSKAYQTMHINVKILKEDIKLKIIKYNLPLKWNDNYAIRTISRLDKIIRIYSDYHRLYWKNYYIYIEKIIIYKNYSNKNKKSLKIWF